MPIVSTASNLITANFSLLISIASGIIVTRSLGPSIKGEYANLILVITLYGPFLLFGYHGGIIYYGLRKKIDLQQFFWTGAFLVLILGLLSIPILGLLVQQGILGEVARNSDNLHLRMALASIPVLFLNTYTERVIWANHMFRAVNVRVIVAAVVTLLYYFIIWGTIGIDLFQSLLGMFIGQVVALIMNLYFVVRKLKVQFRWHGHNIFFPWRYGYKVWVNQIIAQSNGRFDQIILSFLLAPASFGIYVVGVGLSSLVTTLPSSYINVFFTQITERDIEGGLALYERAQRITIILTTAVALMLALLAYPLIYFMYGEDFVAAAWVVIFYTPGLIFQVAARLTIKFYAGQGKPLKNSLINIAGIITSLPFYFILIPRYGIIGAAVASSIAYSAAFFFSFWQMNRDYGLSAKKIFWIKKDDFGYISLQLLKVPVIGKFFPYLKK